MTQFINNHNQNSHKYTHTTSHKHLVETAAGLSQAKAEKTRGPKNQMCT